MDETVASSRQKRQKLDKLGKFAALQKLKELKGAKHKYEVSDVDYVYDEVDEREYSKKVADRQDDWIVDDDGSGYVEDGRDIFDDDLDDESISKNSAKAEKSKKRNRGVSKLAGPSDGSTGSTISSMFMNMPVKKKAETNVKLENDDILGDIMAELNNAENKGTAETSKKLVNDAKTERDYLKSLRQPDQKRLVKPVTPKKKFLRTPEKSVLLTKVITKKKIESPVKEKVPASQLIEDFEPETKDESPEETLIEDCTEDILQEGDLLDGVNEINWDNDEFDLQETKTEAVDASPKTREAVTVKAKPEPAEVKTEHDLTQEQLSAVFTLMEQSRAPEADVQLDTSEIPLTVKDDGKKLLRFYWLDAFEDPYVQPGVVFLFGKVWVEKAKTHMTCCVSVRNIERRVYLLPRENVLDLSTNQPTEKAVSMTDVYNEFNTVVAPKYKISQFKSRQIEKHYAFDLPNIPATCEYLEVRYSASQQALPTTLKGATFCHVFGTTTNSLELLLVDRRIKGPCWLDITGIQPAKNPVSWCKIEAITEKATNICVTSGKPMGAPPLVVAALSMKTIVNPKNHLSEVVMLGCLVHHKYPLDKQAPNPPFQEHFCVITKPTDGTWPFDLQDALNHFRSTRVEKTASERALLAWFLAKLFKLDPDLVVGHDIVNFDLKLLLNRVLTLKVPLWSRLGRLRRTNPSKSDRNVMVGRLVCDIKISGKELIRCRSYDLAAMCEAVLRMKTEDWDELTPDDVRKGYSSSSSIMKTVSRTMQDGAYILKLMAELNVIPLALQITNIAGNLMSRTLMGGRSERNEFLLLHAFTEKDYIVPDKTYRAKKANGLRANMEEMEAALNETVRKGKNKAAYSGGLVLEPKKGFYDKLILLMDFNSLYPSIIQEYNICFTTVTVVKTEGTEEDAEGVLPESGTDLGILPIEIRKLVESRKQVKNLMKAPDLPSDLKLQYNIRQMALKLTANSMYGCLGFSFSRFYAKPLAALVTAKGRDILTNTRDLVQKLGYDVIYGDTDSIMINTNSLDYSEVFKIGNKIKSEVNRLYRLVELDVDGVFKYMLLLKKKKYAAVTMTQLPNGEIVTSQELKGLDIVRRDWSKLSAETGKQVLTYILSDLPPDERIDKIHFHLERIAEDLKAGKVPLTLLAITKQLTKNPEEYADNKSQPHVLVAMRVNSRGGKKLRAGDTVSYIICEDGTNLSAVQRAYSPEELKSNEALKIDVNYYLGQQIHPVVSRLCEPIEGTDAGRIAECLGLDGSAFLRQVQRHEERNEIGVGEKSFLDNEDRFKLCTPLKFTCKNDQCKKEMVVTSPFRKTASGAYELVLESCGDPKCQLQPVAYLESILNAVTLLMRSYIEQYYMGFLICEDPACPQRTRRMPLRFQGPHPVCTLCRQGVMYREYSDNQLYVQLEYFHFMFDLSKVSPADKKQLRVSPEMTEAYAKAREHVERMLLHSAYCVIDLGQLFADCGLTNKGNAKVKMEAAPVPAIKIKEEPMDTY